MRQGWGALLALASASFLLLVFSTGFIRFGVPVFGFYAVPTDALFLLTGGLWAAPLVARQTRLRWHGFFWLIAFYLAALAASALAAPDPERGLVKLATQLYLLSLPILAFNLIPDLRALRRAILVWVAAAGLISALGLLVFALFYLDRDNALLRHTLFHFGSLPPGNYPRLSLSFGNANMLCNYLSVAAAMILVARKVDLIGAGLFRFTLGGTIFSALFTVSPGIGGVALLLGLWLWARHSSAKLGATALIAGLGVALAFLGAAAIAPMPHPTAPFEFRLPLVGTLAPSGRLMLWLQSAETFLRNPLLGAGLGQPSAEVFLLDPQGRRQFLTDAHNSYLNIAAQAGLPGLLALLAITLWIVRRIRPFSAPHRQVDHVRIGLGLAFVSAFFYQGLTGSFEDARHLWVLIGLFLVAERLSGEDAQDEEPSPS